VQIWDRTSASNPLPDDLIGSTTIDVEWRLLHNLAVGEREWRRLSIPGMDTAQGKVLLRLDLLTEDQAPRNKAEELSKPQRQEYELRLVVWNTKDVRLPDDKRKNSEMDQKMSVTANFNGLYGGDVIKWTDVAWYAASGQAEWNYRFKWRLTIPCKVPRVKFQMWNASLISDGEACGECIYNLQPFFNRAMRDKKTHDHQTQDWLKFVHPNYPGVSMGEVCVEYWLLTSQEADLAPVGEAQGDPNRDPYLPDPARNPPPWAVGTRGLNSLERYKYILLCVCILIIAIPIAAPLLYGWATGSL